MTFCRPVTIRAMRSAFSLASAPPRVKKNVFRSPGVTVGEQLAQPAAHLGRELRRGEGQLVRLLGDGVGHALVRHGRC